MRSFGNTSPDTLAIALNDDKSPSLSDIDAQKHVRRALPTTKTTALNQKAKLFKNGQDNRDLFSNAAVP